MAKYAIGIDYGTLSGRALLVNVQSGEELATAVYDYPQRSWTRYSPAAQSWGTTGPCSTLRIIWMFWKKPSPRLSRKPA
jgi:ribulose kinase